MPKKPPKKPPIVGSLRATEAPDTFSATLTVFDQPPDNHPIYNLVGRVAAEWARLEHELDLIIWALAGIVPERGSCFTAQIIGHSNRCFTIIALATHNGISQEIIDRVEKLRNRIFGISERRNRIIHDPWYVDYQGSMTAQFKSMPKKELKYGITEVADAEINSVISIIRDRIDDCRKLRADTRAEIDTSRGKRR